MSLSCLRPTKRRRKGPRETEEGALPQGGQEEGEESGEKSEDEAAEVHVDSETSGDETVLFGPHPVINMNESDSD